MRYRGKSIEHPKSTDDITSIKENYIIVYMWEIYA